MSQAFLFANDGWRWCSRLQDYCTYALADDDCMLPECRMLKKQDGGKGGAQAAGDGKEKK